MHFDTFISVVIGLAAFFYAQNVASVFSKFWSNYPLLRLLPKSQFDLPPIFVKVGSVILIITFILIEVTR